MTAPALPDTPRIIAPVPGANQVDALGQRSRQDAARRVVQAHRAGLMARREHDLLSEKLLLHIDGTGDFQWADILNGQRVEIPRMISEFRKTENVLRLVVDNAVAHHTTMPLRFFAESLPDRVSRDRSMMDTLWMNYVAEEQDLNGLFADALYMAMPAGFCPVHAYWREDRFDQGEQVAMGSSDETGAVRNLMASGPQRGMIDCWVGNPFDTVFDRGAKRGSAYWCSYGRILPAAMVRAAFAHVPEARGLQGTTRIPSVSTFQRIARSWTSRGLGVHGKATIDHRRAIEDAASEELMLVICRETLPGADTDYPKGRLQIVAVPGAADMLRGQGDEGKAVLLADQPLPGGDYSWTLFYSHHRGDDILGKPWVEDVDQLQVDLNIALSKRWEFLNRGIEAPIVAPGGALSEDMMDLGGYNLLEVEPSLAAWRPRTIEWPAYILAGLDREIEDKRKAIFTGGGYQAASRGEAPGSRMAYRAIVALQQADNSIHGPVNMRFKRSACDFARRCWGQMKEYGDVPWLINITGDEYAYLAEPYIDNTKLSEDPPSYKLVNAFGPSPELRAQEVLELMAARGADGQPFLSTEDARRAYPNQMLWNSAGDPAAVQRRRARTIATQFHFMAKKLRESQGLQDQDVASPAVQQAAQQLFGYMESQYPRLRDDALDAHLASLSEITQDETADPIARLAAVQRQNLYYQWQAQMAGPAPMPGAAPAGAPGSAAKPTVDRQGVAAERLGGDETNAPPTASTARG